MTRHKRIVNIQMLGYAQAEVEYLALVAPHGGYFVRRQFDAWAVAEWGKRSEDFLAHLLDRGHGYRQVFARNRQVFPVRIRPLYRAVGGEHCRNCREHHPQAIKARLMTLDSVLALSENRYFGTEREKVAYLCDERGIDHEALPVKVLRSPDGASSTPRYFLDRFPLFTRPGAEELTFCLVDSGFETSGSFATHLRQYCRCSPSFRRLSWSMSRPLLPVWARRKPSLRGYCREAGRGSRKSPIPTDCSPIFATGSCLRSGKPAASIGSGSMRYATTCAVSRGGILPKCSRAGRPGAMKRFAPKLRCRRSRMPLFLLHLAARLRHLRVR